MAGSLSVSSGVKVNQVQKIYMIYAYPAVCSQVEVATRVCRGLFLTRPPAKTHMEKMREKAMQVLVKPVKLFAPFCTGCAFNDSK